MRDKTYLVRWEIEFDTESPDMAAAMALEVMLDPASMAPVFEVFEMKMLDAPEGGQRAVQLGRPVVIDMEGEYANE